MHRQASEQAKLRLWWSSRRGGLCLSAGFLPRRYVWMSRTLMARWFWWQSTNCPHTSPMWCRPSLSTATLISSWNWNSTCQQTSSCGPSKTGCNWRSLQKWLPPQWSCSYCNHWVRWRGRPRRSSPKSRLRCPRWMRGQCSVCWSGSCWRRKWPGCCWWPVDLAHVETAAPRARNRLPVRSCRSGPWQHLQSRVRRTSRCKRCLQWCKPAPPIYRIFRDMSSTDYIRPSWNKSWCRKAVRLRWTQCRTPETRPLHSPHRMKPALSQESHCSSLSPHSLPPTSILLKIET